MTNATNASATDAAPKKKRNARRTLLKSSRSKIFVDDWNEYEKLEAKRMKKFFANCERYGLAESDYRKRAYFWNDLVKDYSEYELVGVTAKKGSFKFACMEYSEDGTGIETLRDVEPLQAVTEMFFFDDMLASDFSTGDGVPRDPNLALKYRAEAKRDRELMAAFGYVPREETSSRRFEDENFYGSMFGTCRVVFP